MGANIISAVTKNLSRRGCCEVERQFPRTGGFRLPSLAAHQRLANKKPTPMCRDVGGQQRSLSARGGSRPQVVRLEAKPVVPARDLLRHVGLRHVALLPKGHTFGLHRLLQSLKKARAVVLLHVHRTQDTAKEHARHAEQKQGVRAAQTRDEALPILGHLVLATEEVGLLVFNAACRSRRRGGGRRAAARSGVFLSRHDGGECDCKKTGDGKADKRPNEKERVWGRSDTKQANHNHIPICLPPS